MPSKMYKDCISPKTATAGEVLVFKSLTTWVAA